MGRPSGYIMPISTGARRVGEKNDCVVRAVTNALDGAVTYNEVHARMKQAGRIDCDGMYMTQYAPVIAEYGFRVIGTFGTTNKANFARGILKDAKKYPGLTMRSAMKFMQNGKFIVAVRGHLTCVIDGEVIDTAGVACGRSVCVIWKLEE